jgi:hypothetical protein
MRGMFTHALTAAAVLAFTAVPAFAAQEKVGVAAAVNPDAMAQPPAEQTRALYVGNDVMHNERISTQNVGQAQILFVDQSSVTVAANSELVVDDFVYNPSSNTGHMAATLSKGLMRYVGGKISKQGDVTIKTPSSVIAIRGGIGFVSIDPSNPYIVVATFVYGDYMCMTGGGATRCTNKNGFAIRIGGQGQPPGDPFPFSNNDINFKVTAMEGRGDRPEPPVPWLDFPIFAFNFWIPNYDPSHDVQSSEPPPIPPTTPGCGGGDWCGYIGGLDFKKFKKEETICPLVQGGCGSDTEESVLSFESDGDDDGDGGHKHKKPYFVGNTNVGPTEVIIDPGSGPGDLTATFSYYNKKLGVDLTYDFDGTELHHDRYFLGASFTGDTTVDPTPNNNNEPQITHSKAFFFTTNNPPPFSFFDHLPASTDSVHWGTWTQDTGYSEPCGYDGGDTCDVKLFSKDPLFWVAGLLPQAAAFNALTGWASYRGELIGDVFFRGHEFVMTGVISEVWSFTSQKGFVTALFDGVAYKGSTFATSGQPWNYSGYLYSVTRGDKLTGTLAGSFYTATTGALSKYDLTTGGNFQIQGWCSTCIIPHPKGNNDDSVTLLIQNNEKGWKGAPYMASGIFTMTPGKPLKLFHHPKIPVG